MKNIDLDKLWIGLLLGMLCPLLALAIYYKVNFSYMTIAEFIRYIKLGDIYTSLVSLSILINLAVFYPFIWKQKYSGARGVLAATFVWAFIVVLLKFFT